jgi:DNA helicase-2/ATP-dependent DNA helicase PcrA
MAYAILKFYARGKLWINRSGEPCPEGVVEGLYTGQETLGKLIVVGDVSQCIYSFRGSDSSILSIDIDHDFRSSICQLSVNWRCPSNILDPVVPSIHINEDSKSQEIVASHKGGEFFAYSFTSYKNMITQLKTDMMKDMEDGMNVAILCRTNFDGLIPAFILEADGRFNFSVSGENMTLNSPLPRKIIGVTSLFTERATPAVKASLEFFAGRGGQWGVKQMIDTLKVNNMSIWQVPTDDIKYSCPSLLSFVQKVKPIFHDEAGNRNKNKELEALRVVYYLLITDVFCGDSAYAESARAYIETMLYILENNDFESVYAFLEEIEYLNDKLNGRIRKKKANIRIATVHEFKGKECDSVYVWNDSDGTFPSSKCDVNNEDQLNEERRVHYIACTRAKKREHIYALQSKMGKFALEMDCKFTNPIKPSASLPKNANSNELFGF